MPARLSDPRGSARTCKRQQCLAVASKALHHHVLPTSPASVQPPHPGSSPTRRTVVSRLFLQRTMPVHASTLALAVLPDWSDFPEIFS